MSYAELVIKETLRLAAIISTLPKRALTTFEMGGYTIPKVSTCLNACKYWIGPSCPKDICKFWDGWLICSWHNTKLVCMQAQAVVAFCSSLPRGADHLWNGWLHHPKGRCMLASKLTLLLHLNHVHKLCIHSLSESAEHHCDGRLYRIPSNSFSPIAHLVFCDTSTLVWEHFSVVQGMQVQVELWRVLQNDARWAAAQGPNHPATFNPDRQARILLFTVAVSVTVIACLMHSAFASKSGTQPHRSMQPWHCDLLHTGAWNNLAW